MPPSPLGSTTRYERAGMLLWEILADVLGAEPTDHNIWLATRRGRSGKELALELLERYRPVDPDPLPAKTPTTFRPAFLLDYHGRSETPYDREFTFVGNCGPCYSSGSSGESSQACRPAAEHGTIDVGVERRPWRLGASRIRGRAGGCCHPPRPHRRRNRGGSAGRGPPCPLATQMAPRSVSSIHCG